MSEPTATPDPTPDPTLAALVPQRSRPRAVLGASAVAAGLLVLLWLPAVVRPSVVPDGPAGTSSVTPPASVVTTLRLTGGGWPWVDVVTVAPVPGARAEAAWLADEVRPDRPPDLGLLPRDALLPERLPQGEERWLVVRWRIDECSALDPAVTAEVVLRTAARTTVREALPDFFSPAFDVATLRRQGVCPSGS